MKNLLFLVCLFFTTYVYGQSNSKIGKLSPDLDFEKILNYSTRSAKLSDYKSKVVLIDFWGTYCSPCIRSLSYLDSLQQRFSNDLQVLTVTSESEERIRTFLKYKKVNLPIVLDVEEKLKSVFPHSVISHTILIDKEGIVRAITTPEEITEDVIRKVLKNEVISLPEKEAPNDFDPNIPLSGNLDADFQMIVTPHKIGVNQIINQYGFPNYILRRILAINSCPQSLYQIAYNQPSTRVISELKDASRFIWAPENLKCYDLIVPPNLSEQRFEIMQNHLDILFGYHSQMEERLIPVKILRIIQGKKVKLNRVELSDPSITISNSIIDGSGLKMKSCSVSTITRAIEMWLQIPVTDETGLIDKYDLEMNWYEENPNQLNKELFDLGLEIVDAYRKVNVLVIKD